MSKLVWRCAVAWLVLGSAAWGQVGQPKATVSAELNVSALRAGRDAVLAVITEIPENLHAQSRTPSEPSYIAFDVKLDGAPGVAAGAPVYPPGENQAYLALGVLNVYTGKVVVYVPLSVRGDAAAGPVTLSGQVRYQACDEQTCFMPQTVKFALDTKIVGAGETVGPRNPGLFAAYRPASTQPGAATAPATQPAGAGAAPTSIGGPIAIDLLGWELKLGSNTYGLAFALAFLVGMIFNVMPCVLPVVPLKAIGFYEVSQHNRGKSVALGAVFSLGIVASFGLLALLVVVLQTFRWGEQFQNPWFVGALVAVLLAMALSMFGAFSVNLPTGVYRFAPRHDTYTGNFLFGILTAALSTPCTFGMFFGLLAWALAQPTKVGVALLLVVGMGMAAPYLVLSALPEMARRLPRTGPWAAVVKQLMGFLLLGTAVYFAGPFINRLLGPGAFWWAVFVVVVAAGLFLVAQTVRYAQSGRAIIASTLIALLMVVPSFFVVRLLTVKPYEWQAYSPEALAAARAQGKVVLVDFTADWCGNCHALEAFVLNRRTVVKTVQDHGVVMLKADVTEDGAPGRPLLNDLNPVGAIPLTAIYAPGLRDPIQLTGIYKVEDLRQAIARAANGG